MGVEAGLVVGAFADELVIGVVQFELHFHAEALVVGEVADFPGDINEGAAFGSVQLDGGQGEVVVGFLIQMRGLGCDGWRGRGGRRVGLAAGWGQWFLGSDGSSRLFRVVKNHQQTDGDDGPAGSDADGDGYARQFAAGASRGASRQNGFLAAMRTVNLLAGGLRRELQVTATVAADPLYVISAIHPKVK